MADNQTEQDANPRIGRYVSTVAFDEIVRAYIPPPLPPNPPLEFSPRLLLRLSEADRAVGRLSRRGCRPCADQAATGHAGDEKLSTHQDELSRG